MVTRAGFAGTTLTSLALSGVTLSLGFVSGTTAYPASVGRGEVETTVTASEGEENAGVEITPVD